ncbi:MAG: peptide ABC transporter substrate-binding protein [Chloroflexi bacterium]|nr:peptide ABC transporter substrate-binding protein [Chloroflexota bacterium]
MRRLGLALPLVALLAVLALAISACTGEAGEKTLRINLGSEPRSLDPNRANFAVELGVIRQLYRGLLSFDRDLQLRPAVAREVPSESSGGISKDGLVYTFRLRSDVTWSDGQPVTARDFAYSIKRLLDPSTAGPYGPLYHSIKGGRDYNASGKQDQATQARLREAVAVEAVNDLTLRITLEQPQPTFLHLMALWPTYPVRQDIVERYGDRWTEPGNQVGNGPFILKEWEHQDHITLARNEKYWGSEAKLDTIEMRMIGDGQAALAAYKSGELDMVAVPSGSEKAVADDSQLSREQLRADRLVVFYMALNNEKAPLDNAKVRQAIATAIDRETFIQQIRRGIGKPATSWVPPGMPGNDADLGKEYRFDPAKARRFLAEAGYPNGQGLPPIVFTYPAAGANITLAEFIQAQLRQNLGIEVQLDGMEPRAFQGAVTQGNYQATVLSFGADYPDPENFLFSMFSSTSRTNWSHYKDSELDRLVAEARKELDQKKRLDLLGKAQERVVSNSPSIPLFFLEQFWLIKLHVKNVGWTAMDAAFPGEFFFDQVQLSR